MLLGALVCCADAVDFYDETDALSEAPGLAADADIQLNLTESDNPGSAPSYADFLIAYPTQSCKLNIDKYIADWRLLVLHRVKNTTHFVYGTVINTCTTLLHYIVKVSDSKMSPILMSSAMTDCRISVNNVTNNSNWQHMNRFSKCCTNRLARKFAMQFG